MTPTEWQQIERLADPQPQDRLPGGDSQRLRQGSTAGQVEIIGHSLSRTVIGSEAASRSLPLDDCLQHYWDQWQHSSSYQRNQLLREAGQFLGYRLHTKSLRSRSTLLRSITNVTKNYWDKLTPTQRLRGWVSFRRSALLKLDGLSEREFLHDLTRLIQKQIIGVWKHRARRNTKANRDFYELRVRRCQAWASRDIPADWLSQFLFSPERTLQHPSAQILKHSPQSTVAVIPGPTQLLMVKRIAPRFRAERWTARWRRSPALHCYRMAYRLQTAGLPTPRPLAIIEQIRHGQLLASYVLTEYLGDTLHLGDYWPHATNHERRQTLDALADILQRLHLYGMSHRDLKVTNILARPRSDQAAELFLIDLGGVSHGWWLSGYRQRKDLARLALSAMITLGTSRTDLLHFLQRYLGVEKQQQWRSWWKTISLFMRCKTRQNVRRKRELS